MTGDPWAAARRKPCAVEDAETIAKLRDENERLRRTMSHAANMLVSFDRFNLVRTARRELLAALSEGKE